MTAHTPFPLSQYGYAVVGILISIVLPILRKQLPSTFGATALVPANIAAASVKTYIIVGIFSLLTAILIVAFGGSAVSTWEWYTAVLAGYAWDSTLQKIVHG
jgi:uncharacterized membrane protein